MTAVAEDSGATRSAATPVRAAGAAWVGAVLSVLVIAIGVLGVRDAVVGLRWVSGEPWIPRAAGVLDGLRPASWTGPAGIALGVLGVALLVVAMLPRRRTGVPVQADTAVYVGRGDVAAVAAAVARDVPGVLRVNTACSPRRVRVRCIVTAEDRSEVEAAVHTAVAAELAVLQSVPRIAVRTRTETRA